MSRSDVVVIGNGVAGLMSALVSAKAGKKVSLLSFGAGTFPLNSGLIDVLGYVDDGSAVKNPLAGIDVLAENHPYKKIGTDNLKKAIEFFKETVASEGLNYIGSVDQQQWIITGVGTLKPTCLLPESMQASKCFNANEIVLVGIKELKDYYVDMVAENLPKELGTDKNYRVVTVDTCLQGGRDLTTRDVAAWVDTEGGYRELVNQLKQHAGNGKVLVVPQILGTKGGDVYRRIVKDLGCEVVETTGMPPSVNGIRLRDAMINALKKMGVRIVENAKAEEAIFNGSKVTAIKAGGEVRLQTYHANKFILATGGFYNGGLTMRDIGAPKEEVFGLQVEADCNEETWANKKLFSDKKHGFALAGVKTDASLRGVNAAGNTVENVYVVGRNLSGYDFCFEHSGNGVAIASAYKAAKA